VGSVSEVDLSQSDSDLASAKADLIGLDRQRAVLENALAVLLGKNPSEYHFAETPLANTQPPLIPSDIPSEVLQRRPDIASATANMAAANERIGVARTAFFPSLILTANGGTQSTKLADIFKWSSRSWAIGQTAGSALALNLLDSGRSFGNLDAAHAAYDEAIANYRQQVLVAMGDVENALTDQKLLAEQANEQERAATTSAKAHELTKKRYDIGDANYFEVVEAQRTMLSANRAAIETRGARQTATVSLIRALGGGWSEGEKAK
jgi:multidrug efflux system outer membrane protein